MKRILKKEEKENIKHKKAKKLKIKQETIKRKDEKKIFKNKKLKTKKQKNNIYIYIKSNKESQNEDRVKIENRTTEYFQCMVARNR